MKSRTSLPVMVVFLCISLASSSQTNLQFNQIKPVTTTEPVPVGKVWKVENTVGGQLIASCRTAPLHQIVINGSATTVTKTTQVVFDACCFGWKGINSVTDFSIVAARRQVAGCGEQRHVNKRYRIQSRALTYIFAQ